MAPVNSASDAPWVAEGGEKRAAVKAMFADIAPTYDLCNALMSFRLHQRWRTIAVSRLGLKPGDRALDVCCGTGDFLGKLRSLVKNHGQVVGIDFCLPMLDRAKHKVGDALALGDACVLPCKAGVFDAVTVGWGIRNVPDCDAAHREIARVLRRGGRFASVDMARPRNSFLRTTSEVVFNTAIPLLGKLFGKAKAYTYLPKSTASFKSREELKESMERAGFTDVQCRDLFFGNICIHWGTKS